MLAVLLALGCLLLPALLAARQSSLRAVCQSNLRQWGLAAQAFVAAREVFPPAATWRIGEPRNGLPVPARHGVFSFLLPFVEQATLSERIDWNRDWDDPVNRPWTRQELGGVLLCPAAPGGREGKHAVDYSTAIAVDPSERTGIGRLLRAGTVRNRSSRGSPSWGVGERVWDGLLQLDEVDYVRRTRHRRRVRPADVRDGLSRTTLIFENAGKPLCFRHGAAARCHISRFRWASPVVWMTINDVEGGEQLLNCHNNSQPYGFHAGGLNFVFADATVRFVAADMAADPLISWFTLRAGD
jgi:hypothetical protein